MPRLLAADACAGTFARDCFRAVSSFRHTSQPDEPEHLHDLRVDVHQGDEHVK
jgi:hypothetical protein